MADSITLSSFPRMQTCVTTLTLRHMAIGNGPIRTLNDLRAPISEVLTMFQSQMVELQRYRARFGYMEDMEEGSDTEQE